MKLDYLQFLELEVFSRFGSRLEASMEAKLRRGQVLREIFKQDRLAPLSAICNLAWMIAYNEGCFDEIPPESVADRLSRLIQQASHGNLTLEDSSEKWQQAVAGWMQESL